MRHPGKVAFYRLEEVLGQVGGGSGSKENATRLWTLITWTV